MLVRPAAEATRALVTDGDDAWHFKALSIGALHAQGVTGAGVRLGVVDTGVLASHPALAGRTLVVRDRRGAAFDGIDVVGHGTQMIGLLIGLPAGIAPAATVISMKAFLSQRVTDLSQVTTGVNLLVDQGVDILSLSLGSSEIDAIRLLDPARALRAVCAWLRSS